MTTGVMDSGPTPKRACPGMTSKLQIPGLADEIDAKAVMLLFLHPLESGARVDAARGDQDALGPQRDRAVAAVFCEADALLDQRTADTEPARFFFHQQQAQFRDLVGSLDQEDRADRLAAHFGNPAVLAPGIEVAAELRGGLGDQPFKTHVPAIFLRIERAAPRHHPAN